MRPRAQGPLENRVLKKKRARGWESDTSQSKGHAIKSMLVTIDPFAEGGPLGWSAPTARGMVSRSAVAVAFSRRHLAQLSVEVGELPA